MLAICSVPCQSQTIDRALFERMVAITKHFEGWHDPKTTPGYVGYGHHYPNLDIILTLHCK